MLDDIQVFKIREDASAGCDREDCRMNHFLLVLKEVELFNIKPLTRIMGIHLEHTRLMADARGTFDEFVYFVCTSLDAEELYDFCRSSLPKMGSTGGFDQKHRV